MSTGGRRRRACSAGLGLGGLAMLLTTLTACGGNGSVETSGRPLAGADNPGDAQYERTGTTCDVDVLVSGSAAAKWSGTGSASQGGAGTPTFTYLAARNNSTVTVYSGANGGPATFTFAQGSRTFSAIAGSAGGGGIVARSDGSRASVDASAVAVGGTRRVSVQATFTC